MLLKDINPATEEVIAEIPMVESAAAHEMVIRAKQGFGLWAAVPLKERLAALIPFLAALESAKEELATLITKEMGRPIVEARTSILKVVESCEYTLAHAEEFLTAEHIDLGGGVQNELQHIPTGVVLAISPWNYPLQLALYSILPALICGNAVIHKPSRITPLVGLKIQELLERCLPPAVLQTIICNGEVASQVVEDQIDTVALIGSTGVGQEVMRRAAAGLKNVMLELGGKDAMLILDDADMAAAATQGVSGSVKNAGQACNAVERIYVPAAIHDQFVQAVGLEIKKIKVGNPLDEQTTMGPLASAEQRATVEAHLADAIAKGARLIAGGKRLPGPGYFFEPTVLTGVNHAMDSMTKETFGPVVAIQSYATEEEAIRLVNDSHYGLTASVWTGNVERGKQVAEKIRAGCVGINHLCRSHPAVPWGGMRQSGIGRMLGKDGLRAFCEIRNIRYQK